MPFGSLWLPVVASAVAVWLVSSILHMALKYHKADYKRLGNPASEAAVAQALRAIGPAPGVYPIPYCEPSQMKDPENLKKYEEGPVGMITILANGAPNMGRYLGLWLGFCFLVSFTAGYVARHTLEVSSDPMEILRITGALAFVGYGYGNFQDAIWRGMPWSNAMRGLIDAVIYSVVTGMVFRLLWPSA